MSLEVLLRRAGDRPEIVVSDVAAERPGADEVDVELVAADVSPLDRQIVAGRLPMAAPPPLRLGTSAVARVVSTDIGDLAAGTLVTVLGTVSGMGITRPGTLATRFPAQREYLVPLPTGLDPLLAAAGGPVGLSARLALFDVAAVAPGETVLVLGSTGGVGRAAVAAAAAHHARVIAAARNPFAAAALTRDPAVTATGFDGLEATVAGLTEGVGVDVIIDCVGGPILPAAMRVGSHRCRHVVVGYSAGMTTEVSIGALIAREHRLMGFNAVAAGAPRQATVMAEALRDIAEGRVRPAVGSICSLRDAAEAFAPTGATHGRTVLVWSESVTVR